MDIVSDFPKFQDGDVYIVVSASHTYQLHSSTLRRLSPFFQHQLDNYPGAKLSAAAKRDGAAAYRFELNKMLPEDFGRFIRVRLNDNGKPQRDGYLYPEFQATLDEREARLWDWVFGSFYNLTPKFEDHNLATVLQDCMNLVDAADSIGSIEHVREIVDLALLRQDQVLWRSIATNPVAWTELGRRIHSQSIFREGMTHLVGLWNKISENDREQLDDVILDLCERKHKEIDFVKRAIDLRILGHYPSFLSRNHVDKPQRTSYSTDIYMWMAVAFYRQFFAQAIVEGRTRESADGGWKFYSTIAAGGNAYLHHEDFQEFYQYFPMSSKACNVLEANMNVLKEDVRGFVQDLMVNRAHVQPEDFPIDWLTCIIIEKEDMPWMAESGADCTSQQRQIDNFVASQSDPLIYPHAQLDTTDPELVQPDLDGFNSAVNAFNSRYVEHAFGGSLVGAGNGYGSHNIADARKREDVGSTADKTLPQTPDAHAPIKHRPSQK